MTSSSPSRLAFGPFVLDEAEQALVRDGAATTLQPKVFETLRHLARRPGQLVTKRELLDAVWPDVIVGDSVLKVIVHEIRRLLGDDARRPAYVETVHRRGYRFVAAVTTEAGAPAPAAQRGDVLVGRDDVLEHLRRAWQDVTAGRRRAVFVSGEAGIGKTSVVQRFLDEVRGAREAVVLAGDCLEASGRVDAFHAVLDALGRGLGAPGADALTQAVCDRAPSWRLHVPGAVAADELDDVRRRALGTSRDGMQRELAAALEHASRAAPLLLVLEDLHWSDSSTVDLLEYLAARPDPARLLLLGTYRPVDAIVSDHPLRPAVQRLCVRGAAEDVPLESLLAADVLRYVRARFPDDDRPEDTAGRLHAHTDGHPFFLASLADELESRAGAMPDDVLPRTVRQMIDRKLAALAADTLRRLGAAAVLGVAFASDDVAQLTGDDVATVEDDLDRLAAAGRLVAALGVESRPGGEVAARFRFRHGLVRRHLRDGLAPARRVRHHRAAAALLRARHADDLRPVAASIVAHCEQGGDDRGALEALLLAADAAARRTAPREALALLERAVEQCARLPAGEAERAAVLERFGRAHLDAGDWSAAAAVFEDLADRARDEGRAADEARLRLRAASALFWLDRDRCLRAARRALALVPRLDDDLLRAHVEGYVAYWDLVLDAWRPGAPAACAAAVRAARAAGDERLLAFHLVRHAYFLCIGSAYADAADAADEGARRAVAQGDVHAFLIGRFCGAWARLHAGALADTRRLLLEALELAERNDLTAWATLFRLELGWLHEHAGDTEGAERYVRAARDAAAAAGDPYGSMVGGILLGYVALARDDLDAAERHLGGVEETLRSRRVVMDWVWRSPLWHGLAEVALGRGDIAAARAWTARVLERAELAGDRFFESLALRRLAVLETTTGGDGGPLLERALDAVGAAHVPLAAWRVHASVAEHAARTGDTSRAAHHRRAAQDLLAAMRAPLGDDDPLALRLADVSARL